MYVQVPATAHVPIVAEQVCPHVRLAGTVPLLDELELEELELLLVATKQGLVPPVH